jgi:hypothetical protein
LENDADTQEKINNSIKSDVSALSEDDPNNDYLRNIDKSANLSGEVVEDLRDIHTRLAGTQAKLTQAEKDAADLQNGIKERDKALKERESKIESLNKAIKEKDEALEEEKKLRKSAVTKFMLGLLGLAILGIAGCVYMFLNKPDQKIIYGAISCGVVCIASLTVIFFMEKFAVIGICTLLGAIAISFGYAIYNHRRKEKQLEKEKALSDKGLRSSVHLIEAIKPHLDADHKPALFGATQGNGLAGELQGDDPLLRARIRAIREEIAAEDAHTGILN